MADGIRFHTFTTAGGTLSATGETDGRVIGSIMMLRRKFSDREGVERTVAESPPHVVTLVQRDRRSEPRSQLRAVGAPRLATRPLELPFLQFESSRERRQLMPIPPHWDTMLEDDLEDLLGAYIVLSRA